MSHTPPVDSKGAAIQEALEDLIIDKIGQNYIETNLKGTVYVVGANGLVEAILAILAQEVKRTAKLNRIELAKDIKSRHWANDKLRDAYLDAVIEVAKEELERLG